MPEYEPPIRLGLSDPTPSAPPPPVESLQFRRAEANLATPAQTARTCASCQTAISGEYFQAQGQDICPVCAERIKTGQQAPPSISLVRAAIFGAIAALGGCILYATVAIVTGFEIGFIAIAVGLMVGKAIRYASHGLGGRPQQILAVALTYFAITTSYIPVFIYQQGKSAPSAEPTQQLQSGKKAEAVSAEPRGEPMSLGAVVLYILALTAIAPFFGLVDNPISGLIGLFIIFIGLQQAWRLTARPDVLITGPYQPSEVHAA